VDHAGVVEDEQVAGRQEAGQVGEMQIGKLRRDPQQPAVGAASERCLGDQFLRERVIEIVESPGHELMR
jgi:hypothetical protein